MDAHHARGFGNVPAHEMDERHEIEDGPHFVAAARHCRLREQPAEGQARAGKEHVKRRIERGAEIVRQEELGRGRYQIGVTAHPGDVGQVEADRQTANGRRRRTTRLWNQRQTPDQRREGLALVGDAVGIEVEADPR